MSIVLEITFSYFSILGFLMNFHDFQVFVFGYRAQKENPEITENLYLLKNRKKTVNLFFDHYCNFLSIKTEINKNKLNLINLDGL